VNVALRDVQPNDGPWLDTWLGACAASVAYDTIDPDAASLSLLKRLEAGGLLAKVIRTHQNIGIVAYRVDAPATIEFVGVQSAHTRRGYGHAGAALVEEVVQASGATAIYAPAPALHSIAMYFWIRLGYRPVLQHEWPCHREGVAWLKRDLSRAP